MHPWKADAEGRDRQRFVRQRSDGGRIPAHHVPGQALHQDGLPADGKAPRTCGAGAAVSGRCAGLLLSDRPEKDALSAWRTGDGGAAGIVCCTLRAGSAGTDRVPAGKIDIFIFCAELLKFCMELVNFFEYHLTTREISV